MGIGTKNFIEDEDQDTEGYPGYRGSCLSCLYKLGQRKTAWNKAGEGRISCGFCGIEKFVRGSVIFDTEAEAEAADMAAEEVVKPAVVTETVEPAPVKRSPGRPAKVTSKTDK